jgi:uracil-DNA glycosylase family 4
MRREEVYIANVVKCRPPENRNPESDEIAACEPFLVKQLDLIKPRIIVALGTFAAQTLLKSKTPISRLRGVWHTYQGIKLMPTLHPAYLLRNPNDKRLVWQDIQAVLREMGRL